jgi:transposase InsO family protein
MLRHFDISASMGRTGSCFDNAAAESFFASLKAEIGTKVWATRDEARRAVFAYLTYYNHGCLYSPLPRQTPYEARISYRSTQHPRGMKPGVRSRGGTSACTPRPCTRS